MPVKYALKHVFLFIQQIRFSEIITYVPKYSIAKIITTVLFIIVKKRKQTKCSKIVVI